VDTGGVLRMFRRDGKDGISGRRRIKRGDVEKVQNDTKSRRTSDREIRDQKRNTKFPRKEECITTLHLG